MVSVNGGSDVERALLSDVSVDVGWRLSLVGKGGICRPTAFPSERGVVCGLGGGSGGLLGLLALPAT